MKVWTKVVYQWDGERYVEVGAEGYDYDGPVALCKGDKVANQQRQEELNMQKAAIARQNAQQDYVKDLTTPYTTGSGVGYDPALFSAAVTNFLSQNTMAYGGAGNAIKNALLARGGGGGNAPIGGDYIRGIMGLESAKANSQAQGLNNLNLQNLQTALNNRWNAMSILNGQPAQLDTQIGSTANAASSALNSYVTAANSGFLSNLTSAFGGALGKGLGAITTGGISGGLNKVSGTNWFGNGQRG